VEETLRTFQNLLTQVPKWSEETLQAEVDRIIESSGCEYLDDLLMGVFLAYIRAFASLQYQGESPHINLTFERPPVAKFLHEFYKHGARAAWKSAFLFKTHGVPAEQQARNRRDIEVLLDKCLGDVINAFIPWKEVSRAYFQPGPEPVAPPPPPPVRPDTPRPSVSFGELEEEEEASDSDESHTENRPVLKLGDDVTDVDLGIVDEKEEEQEVNLDSLVAGDTLVLKL
jgi:hypothetical protein